MNKIFFIGFVVILLSGCSTTAERMEAKVANLPLSERAYLAGKFTVNCSPHMFQSNCSQHFWDISLLFRYLGEDEFIGVIESVAGATFTDNTVYDVIDKEKGELSHYFCLSMPSGEYSFYSIWFTGNTGGNRDYFIGEDEHFEIPFFLEPGKISLVDSLKITSTEGKSKLFGMRVFGPGNLYLAALTTNDIDAAILKCPTEVQGFEQSMLELYKQEYNSPFVISISK